MRADDIVISPDRGSSKRRFRTRHWVRLPGFLPPRTLKILSARLTDAAFVETPRPASRRDASPHLGRLMTFLLSRRSLFEFVEEVAGPVRRIRRFDGVACRQCRDPRHYVDWHVDNHPASLGRLIGATLVVNLGGSYRGGTLLMKSPVSGRVVARVRNTRAGDAILFRNSLPHKSTPVLGRRAKLTFVGWFFA